LLGIGFFEEVDENEKVRDDEVEAVAIGMCSCCGVFYNGSFL
jgi:hypothetical protein